MGAGAHTNVLAGLSVWGSCGGAEALGVQSRTLSSLQPAWFVLRFGSVFLSDLLAYHLVTVSVPWRVPTCISM